MVTVKVLFAGLLIVAFAPSQGLVPDKVRSARDAEVVRAIQEELLTPYARQNLGIGYFTPVLSAQTLAICPPVPTVPCISQFDLNQARNEAINGMWSFPLAKIFAEENGIPRQIDPLPGVLIGVAPPNVRRPLVVSISTPVYEKEEALVLVQFARQVSWLVSLVNSSGQWRVHKRVIIADR